MMLHISYENLVSKFGEITALECLAEIEKAAHIQPDWLSTNPDARLANALAAQDAVAMQFAA